MRCFQPECGPTRFRWELWVPTFGLIVIGCTGGHTVRACEGERGGGLNRTAVGGGDANRQPHGPAPAYQRFRPIWEVASPLYDARPRDAGSVVHPWGRDRLLAHADSPPGGLDTANPSREPGPVVQLDDRRGACEHAKCAPARSWMATGQCVDRKSVV